MSHYAIAKEAQSTLQGFVLLMVLLFLPLFSLLGLYTLMQTAEWIKSQHHEWQGEQERLVANAILHEVEQALLHQKLSCPIALSETARLIHMPRTWWQQSACQGRKEGARYYYVVEDLGNDRLGIMRSTTLSYCVLPHYYRITLLMLSANIDKVRRYVQSTVATASNQVLACEANYHWVSLGQQMVREL